MEKIKLIINGQKIETTRGTTILEAARSADIYIPTLCYHPDLPPAKAVSCSGSVYRGTEKIDNASHEEHAKGCGLCLVEIQGTPDLAGSCSTNAEHNMIVTTDSDRIKAKRKENLTLILARHPHACLTCAQQEGCSRTQCSSNVPENQRCCPKFGHCELQDVANYVGISDSTPKWIPSDLPVYKDHPLFETDYNLCIGCTRCVRACNDLRGVGAIGFVYESNGKLIVGTKGPGLQESGCRFCTACVEVCPTGALTDKDVRPGTKESDILPCMHACPVHVDIPGYLRLIAQGKKELANLIIREKVPFPGVLGRVCIHPCEDVCRRGKINQPVNICALKRYAADQDTGAWKRNLSVKKQTQKKVAIIGAGPAGLTAGFYLRKQGHEVCIFEKKNQAGGMLRYGIPRYRLPESVLDKEIADIFDMGIAFKPDQTLGKDFSLDSLSDAGYDAVFICVGLVESRKIPLKNSDLPDVMLGIDFLRNVVQGKHIGIKQRVLVIGGGNVAIDVAMTALRCGAQQVFIASLEKGNEIPASESEIRNARLEGVQLLEGWGPEEVLSQDGKVVGMVLFECTSVFDKNGKFCPVFGDIQLDITVDQIILATGQASELSFLADTGVTTLNGLIIADEQTLETEQNRIYAGGDIQKGPGAVIHAIAAGRKAASAIDKALGGTGEIGQTLFETHTRDQYLGEAPGFAKQEREEVPELEPEIRTQSFDEIYTGYDHEQAIKEAKRCLQCDLRLYMGCNPGPPVNKLAFNMETIDPVPETEGVYQLLDQDNNVLAIKGTESLRQSLIRAFDENENAAWFEFEEDKMYSQRESELIQRYLQEHGEMPGQDEDDDLF